MKSLRLALAMLLVFCSAVLGQQILREISQVINIEVPVRVFKAGRFVDDLTIKDFEVLEDGVPQKVEAVYLIRKDTVTRGEDKQQKYRPQTARTFFLFFEVSEWDARLGESVDYFCSSVLLPRDRLIAVTPVKTYRLKEEGFTMKSREDIAAELKSLIRKDALIGDAEYRSALKDLADMAQILNSALGDESADSLSSQGMRGVQEGLLEQGIDVVATHYVSYLQRLESLREVNELRMMDFAQHLKEQEGQKYVFLFYQREYIPMIDPKVFTASSSSLQDVEGVDLSMLLADVANWYNQDMGTDVERVKRAFADASTAVHFLFITKPAPNIPGVYFQERSSDTFTPFAEMAKASGGFMSSSANPNFLFKQAVEASENYYLLYYAPKDYMGDGKFKTIKVRIKGEGFKTIHRLGYFSN
ncbi:MAG: hypothetical protein ACERK6_04440 [Candidatus Aminicenantaceae bacterium]